MLVRVLIKYLEQKDEVLFRRARFCIKDCARRYQRGDPGYELVLVAMQRRLKDLVGETYWRRAQEFLIFFQQRQREQTRLQEGGGGSGLSTNEA